MNRTNQKRLETIKTLRLPEIWAQFEAIVGEPTRCPNKTYLLRRITEALEAQEQAAKEAREAERAARRNEPQAAATPAREATPRSRTTEGPEAREKKGAAESGAPAGRERKLSELTVDELRSLYVEEIGRPTGSTHRRYLIWKISEGRKGRITLGPIERPDPAETGMSHRILPLRMPVETVDALDEAWRRHGFKSRMEFFRQSLDRMLKGLGEAEVGERILAG